jgi:hypothetical protein
MTAGIPQNKEKCLSAEIPGSSSSEQNDQIGIPGGRYANERAHGGDAGMMPGMWYLNWVSRSMASSAAQPGERRVADEHSFGDIGLSNASSLVDPNPERHCPPDIALGTAITASRSAAPGATTAKCINITAILVGGFTGTQTIRICTSVGVPLLHFHSSRGGTGSNS